MKNFKDHMKSHISHAHKFSGTAAQIWDAINNDPRDSYKQNFPRHIAWELIDTYISKHVDDLDDDGHRDIAIVFFDYKGHHYVIHINTGLAGTKLAEIEKVSHSEMM